MINAGENENGASPLHLAAAVSHKEMVRFLFFFRMLSVFFSSLFLGGGWRQRGAGASELPGLRLCRK